MLLYCLLNVFSSKKQQFATCSFLKFVWHFVPFINESQEKVNMRSSKHQDQQTPNINFCPQVQNRGSIREHPTIAQGTQKHQEGAAAR